MIAGIIAEYDPFHNGHALHLACTRAAGADTVTTVMSGSIMQRGGFALWEKAARVRAALAGGVDLCVELPVPWACAAAADFAAGGVSLLRDCGAELLSFGSEAGELMPLKVAAAAVVHADADAVKQGIKRGLTYPAALGGAVDAASAAILRQPNNMLAVEYINAASRLAPDMTLFTIRREGEGHDSDEPSDSFASASYIRRGASERGLDAVRAYLPQPSAEALEAAAVSRPEEADRTLLYMLRRLSPAYIAGIDGVTEGLENRIAQAAAEATSFEQAADLIKTKRYTLARIRRLLFRCLLGLEKGSLPELPPYVRVLGFDRRGQELLGRIKKNVVLLTKPADYTELSPRARAVFETELRASELFALTMPPARAGAELRFTPVVYKG